MGTSPFRQAPRRGELCLARVRHAVRALLMAQTPIPPGRQVPQHPTVRLRHQRTVPEYDSEGQQPGMMPMGSGWVRYQRNAAEHDAKGQRSDPTVTI